MGMLVAHRTKQVYRKEYGCTQVYSTVTEGIQICHQFRLVVGRLAAQVQC